MPIVVSSGPTRGAFLAARQNAVFFNPMPHMAEYLADKEAAGLARKSLSVMRTHLAFFADYCRSQGIRNQYGIERQHIVGYQRWLNEQSWAKSTCVERLRAVQAWLNWMQDMDYIDETPWRNIRGVTRAKKVPNPLSDDDLAAIFHQHFSSAFNMDPFVFHRREIMLCLLYGWGLRIHELISIDCRDMGLKQDFVRVRNKGGGMKTLPYTDEMKNVFRRWLGIRARRANRDEDALLITQSGERWNDNDVYKSVVDLGERAGVKINPHRLRDTLGSQLLDDDVPVERVQQILGHANMSQTLQYSKVNNRKVYESHAAAMNPRLKALLTTGFKRPSDDVQF